MSSLIATKICNTITVTTTTTTTTTPNTINRILVQNFIAIDIACYPIYIRFNVNASVIVIVVASKASNIIVDGSTLVRIVEKIVDL